MRPVTLRTTDASGGATTSAVWKPDTSISPFAVSIVIDVTGTVNVDIEHTLDDPDSASALWLDHASLVAKTADSDGNYAFPVCGIRAKQNSGSGSCRIVLVQAG